MPLKSKRYIFLPLALAAYAIVMAVIGYPNYKQSGNLNEFWMIYHQIGCNIFVLTKAHGTQIVVVMPCMYTTSCT